MGAPDAMDFLLEKIKHTKTNKEFFEMMNN
jgi:transcription termination factor Rho